MKNYRHLLGIAVSLSAVGAVLLFSTREEPPVSRPRVRRPVVVIEPPEEDDLSWNNHEVAPLMIWDRVVCRGRLRGLPNFYGQLIHIERVGPPGKMEYYSNPEEMRRSGLPFSAEDAKAMEIGRRQTYNLLFISDHGALIEIVGFRAGAHGDGKIEPLLFQVGLYPCDIRQFHEGACCN